MTHDHPTAQVLAEFADGLLAPAAAAEIQGHIASCAECEQTVVQLGAVASQLRDLPAEVAMPADVAARMSAAIEREVDVRAENARRVHETVSPGPIAWFRRRLPQALVATSVVGLLVVFGSVLSNNPSGSNDAGTSGGGVAEDLGTSDDSYGLEQDSPEAAQAPARKMSPDEIRDEIRRVWSEGAEFRPNCGRELAAEQEQELVGSTELGTGVLIVLEAPNGDELNGWVVPGCAYPGNSAIRDMIAVPIPGR